MQDRDGLLIVDVQNDFCPGGSLAVKEGDQVVPVLNRYIEKFTQAGLPIFATRDWHPESSRHFITGGGQWPVHCVGATDGANFHPGLALGPHVVIVSKGMSPDSDSYSGFDATDSAGIKLADLLRQAGVKRLFIGGLATDYCVKQTVLDALQNGFEVVLLEDAMRGVDLTVGDSARAVEEMVRAGAHKSSTS